MCVIIMDPRELVIIGNKQWQPEGSIDLTHCGVILLDIVHYHLQGSKQNVICS